MSRDPKDARFSKVAITQALTLPSAAPDSDRQEGLTLRGRYRLERLLGEGGMGRVFKGRHLTLNVPIAVKIMHPALAAVPEHAARFEREAHAASVLQHRHVVRVLDYGLDSGFAFIVMEFLSGETLGSFIQGKSTPPLLEEVIPLLMQTLDALEAAHASGIVHRDLKPENIFITTEANGTRIAKVVDFGLAHVDVPAEGGATLTKADHVAGTPLYMSPEQCHSLAVGPSTDLYAFGCILTEALQMAPPFVGPTPMDIITKQLFLPPLPLNRPPDAEPIPPLLERLRLDLLRKQPSERPKSAGEVRRRLAEALSREHNDAELPGRQGVTGFLDREARKPEWSQPPAARVSDAPLAPVEVALVNLGNVASVDPSLVIALAQDGITLTTNPRGSVAAIIVAAADCAIAEEWLRAERPSVPTLVSVPSPPIDAMNRLIAAGTADILPAPLVMESLKKRLGRVLRRRR